MKKYLFLSSAFLMTMAGANAADKIITSANTCTVDVLGVSDNNAIANTIATWDLIDYTLDPGEYLKVTDTSVTETTCPAGSYCVGGGFTVETANNSIAQCPTGYPNSANGASTDTQCYTACTVANANIAHATAVSGNDYYGTGTDTCYATECLTGYHVNGDIELIEKPPLIPADYTVVAYEHGNIDTKSELFHDYETMRFDYGTVYIRGSCQPTIRPELEYFITNMEALSNGTIPLETFVLDIERIVGPIKSTYLGELLENVQKGDVSEDELWKTLTTLLLTEKNANYKEDSVGRHCYCQMVGFKSNDGVEVDIVSAPWVYNFTYSPWYDVDTCDSYCGSAHCAHAFSESQSFTQYMRAALYGMLDYIETGECTANTINIDWNPDNGGDHIKNMCTYEGAIELPTPDPVKPGYTFTGWKLVE